MLSAGVGFRIENPPRFVDELGDCLFDFFWEQIVRDFLGRVVLVADGIRVGNEMPRNEVAVFVLLVAFSALVLPWFAVDLVISVFQNRHVDIGRGDELVLARPRDGRRRGRRCGALEGGPRRGERGGSNWN